MPGNTNSQPLPGDISSQSLIGQQPRYHGIKFVRINVSPTIIKCSRSKMKTTDMLPRLRLTLAECTLHPPHHGLAPAFISLTVNNETPWQHKLTAPASSQSLIGQHPGYHGIKFCEDQCFTDHHQMFKI